MNATAAGEDDPEDDPDVEGDIEVEARLERFLEELAGGRTPDLEALAHGLSAAARARLRAMALAQELLARRAAGEPAALEEVRARLASEEERRIFHQTLEDARRARTRLPGELVPGTCLDGRYEIRSELGRGGMGIVYAAFDHELEREVAVKVLRPAGPGAAQGWEELLLRESKTLARLASQNIVAIHDVCRGAEHRYIVMDLVRGRDLLQILQEVRPAGAAALQPGSSSPPAPAPRSPEGLRAAVGRASAPGRPDLLRERTHARCVARIARQIALTLEHAHEVGVIHRDIKPQNIVLVPGGEPVLLDFGLASWGEEGSEAGFRGTPEYMAPEQIERLQAGNDPRTDVYQLGLVLYEMLALRRAFPRRSREELWPLFQRIQAGETLPLLEAAPHVPRALAAIVARAMASAPARRYAHMRALREDLERFLAGLPPRGAPLPRAQRVGLLLGYAARRPLTAVGAALALAAVLLLRPAEWVPPEFAVLEIEGDQVLRLEASQPIQLQEEAVLALEVRAEQPTWLYVFQLFGSSEDPSAQYLRPVCPLTPEEYETLASYPPPRPVRVASGEHRLVCTELSQPEDFEGLLVYSSPDESEALAQWQRRLHDLELAEGLRVPYLEARSHLAQLQEGLRGDPLGTLDPATRRRAVGALLAAEQGAEAPDDGPRRYSSLHRVERRREDG